MNDEEEIEIISIKKEKIDKNEIIEQGSNIIKIKSISIKSKTGRSKKIKVKSFEDINTVKNDVCQICLHSYEDYNNCLYLKCKHFFHTGCLFPWIKKNKRCPLCKKPIK